MRTDLSFVWVHDQAEFEAILVQAAIYPKRRYYVYLRPGEYLSPKGEMPPNVSLWGGL